MAKSEAVENIPTRWRQTISIPSGRDVNNFDNWVFFARAQRRSKPKAHKGRYGLRVRITILHMRSGKT
jgi:hypothetical protein